MSTQGRSQSSVVRASRLAAALALGVAVLPPAHGQNPPPPPAADAPQIKPVVTITYQGANPKGDFAFKFVPKGKDDKIANPGPHVRPVGLLNWTVPEDQFAANGLTGANGTFFTFCAEPLVGVVSGRTYQFELQLPDSPAAYGLPNNEAGLKEARFRANYIRELYGRFYTGARLSETPDSALAFQAALWEIIFEGDLPANMEPVNAPYDLFSGTFQANYPNLAASPAYVQLAQTYLQSLTGDMTVFAQNLPDREIVRLRGLPTMVNGVAETPQSQFALQNTSTGAGGAGGLMPGAPVGGMPGFFGPGGFGAPFGRGPLAAFPGGFGGTGTPGTTSTTTTPSNQTTTPVTPTPPSSNITIPPVNQPQGTPPGQTTTPPTEQPTTVVPAPAGLLLGLFALGAVATRRVVSRRHTPKS